MRVDDDSSVGKRTRFDNNLHNVAFGGRARTTGKKNYIRPGAKLWAHRRKVNTRAFVRFSQKKM
ncbi:hypothetical protein [Methylocystis rosea]|uniref:hypothetical protein n=1 Tax=Methylocystis rosea TaxID=173366 RepID=UPI000382A3A6|nr:hypothetical protein [Methylocystis rosea]